MPKLLKSQNRAAFNKAALQVIIFISGLTLLIGLFREFTDTYASIHWIFRYPLLLLLLVGFTLALSFYRAEFTRAVKKRDSMSRFFFWGIRIIIFILLVLGGLGVMMILESSSCVECGVYKAVGLGIITVWACIFLSYFIWAIYYYNINLGLTDEEWHKIDEAKESKRQGNFYSQADIDEEPKYNPYSDQTFGLPAGTVRGMIAFTLLFGAIAMLVVSFGMTNELDPSSLFWDQYEFYKTAFLMMIAFYFGSRSLQYLKGGSSAQLPGGPSGGANASNEQGGAGENPLDATGKEVPILAGFEDPMKSEEHPEPVPVKETKAKKKAAKEDDDFSVEHDPMNQ